LKLIGLFSNIDRCTTKNIYIASEIAKAAGADLIIGAGGGSVVDTAKAVADKLSVPVINIPTVASTNADISAESVIYDKEGKFLKYIIYPENPKAVIVDTHILASAPPRFIVSGMGDALASRFETEACVQSRSENNPGGRACDAILEISRLCFNTLIDKGESALEAVKNKQVSPDVESVIEAIKFQSGVGFESGGLAAAHAIHNGFTRKSPVKGSHGEIVAFSVIAQLFLEDRIHSLIEKVASWCYRIGLPTTLADLSVSEKYIEAVAEAACAPDDTMKNEPLLRM